MECSDGVGNKLSSSFRSFFRLAKHFATHYWRARSMNRKDGRSIDWRWGSLIPLSADDGVYGDQNKSVKKARDDTKGKFAEIFSCSGRLEASLKFLFSFLSPIVFLLFPTFYFACTFTSRLAHTESSDISTSCISSLRVYLAQFCRNCCGIAFSEWFGGQEPGGAQAGAIGGSVLHGLRFVSPCSGGLWIVGNGKWVELVFLFCPSRGSPGLF